MMLAALGAQDNSAEVLAAANAQTIKANSDLAAYVGRLESEIEALGLTPTVEKVSGTATLFEAVDYYIVGIREYGEAASRVITAGMMGTDPSGLARTMASDGRLGQPAQQGTTSAGGASYTATSQVMERVTQSQSTPQTTQQAVIEEAVTSGDTGEGGRLFQGNTLLLVGGAALVLFFLMGRGK
jgi:hypothetical protein